MLRKPRPLPQRFNRPVTPQTRRLVEQRMHRHRANRGKQWQRTVQCWQRKMEAMRASIVGFLLFAVPATMVVALGFLLFSSVLHIKEVRIPLSDPRINVDEIRQGLAPLFGRHLFFLPLHEATMLTRDVVPDLQDVTVIKQYPATLEVRLTLDPIVARLSIEDPNASTESGAIQEDTLMLLDFLTMDGTYVTYADAQVQSGADLLHLHIVDWGIRPVPGIKLLEPELLTAMETAEAKLRDQFNRAVTLRTVFLRGREYHLETPLHTLWFDLRTPVGEQLARYQAFLQVEGENAAKKYVDLRLVDKVVFR